MKSVGNEKSFCDVSRPSTLHFPNSKFCEKEARFEAVNSKVWHSKIYCCDTNTIMFQRQVLMRFTTGVRGLERKVNRFRAASSAAVISPRWFATSRGSTDLDLLSDDIYYFSEKKQTGISLKSKVWVTVTFYQYVNFPPTSILVHPLSGAPGIVPSSRSSTFHYVL